MIRFLLDANISHETAYALRSSGFDVMTVGECGLQHAADTEIAAKAIELDRMVITFDLDFGGIHHFGSQPLSVIVLRLSNQTVEFVSNYLQKLLTSKEFQAVQEKGVLLVADENGFRIRKHE